MRQVLREEGISLSSAQGFRGRDDSRSDDKDEPDPDQHHKCNVDGPCVVFERRAEVQSESVVVDGLRDVT